MLVQTPLMFKAVSTETGLVCTYMVTSPEAASKCAQLLRPGAPVSVRSRVRRLHWGGGYLRQPEREPLRSELEIELDIGDLELSFHVGAKPVDFVPSVKVGATIGHVQYDGSGEWLDVRFSTGETKRISASDLYVLALERGETR